MKNNFLTCNNIIIVMIFIFYSQLAHFSRINRNFLLTYFYETTQFLFYKKNIHLDALKMLNSVNRDFI